VSEFILSASLPPGTGDSVTIVFQDAIVEVDGPWVLPLPLPSR
jgi:hypothetical protein